MDKIEIIGIVIIGAIFMATLICGYLYYIFSTMSETKITVSDKGFWVSGGAGDAPVMSFHLVYSKDGRVFNNVNNIFVKKFRSDELQSKLKKGKTYIVKYYGVRLGFFGIRPNIVKIIREVKK
jgi:hypothetical protein